MRTAVIGAGIAGLAAAREITQAGGEAVIFEAADYPGGRIKTVRRNGFQFDLGAFIYLGSYAQATEMMRAVGLASQMAKVPATARCHATAACTISTSPSRSAAWGGRSTCRDRVHLQRQHPHRAVAPPGEPGHVHHVLAARAAGPLRRDRRPLQGAQPVPEGKGMLTVFCRHEWCLEHLEAPQEEVVEQVLRFIAPYYGDLSSDVEDVEIGRWREVVPIMRKGRFKAVDRFMRTTDPRARVQLAGDIGPIPGINGALVSGTQAGRRLSAARATR